MTNEQLRNKVLTARERLQEAAEYFASKDPRISHGKYLIAAQGLYEAARDFVHLEDALKVIESLGG